MKTATFDSNVWRRVVSPHRFPQDPAGPAIQAIYTAIREGQLAGFIAETVLTLEAVKRAVRRDFLDEYTPSVDVVERPGSPGLTFGVQIGPDSSAWPGMHPMLLQHFSDALSLGMQVLRAPRIGGIVNPEIDPNCYVKESPEDATQRQERTFEAMRRIEARGAGIATVQRLMAVVAPGQVWHTALSRVPESQIQRFADAIAEWADGDAVAAHIGYGCDYFVTEDKAESAGSAATLAPGNRSWLSADFGVQFVTTRELAAQLT